jgi:hypothetical protein
MNPSNLINWTPIYKKGLEIFLFKTQIWGNIQIKDEAVYMLQMT